MMLLLASTVTPALGRVRPGYPFLQLVQYLSQVWDVILGDLAVVQQQTRTTTALHGAAEPVSLLILSRMARLHLQVADRAAGGSVPTRTPQARRTPGLLQDLPIERPLPRPATERRAPSDLVLYRVTLHSDLRPAGMKVGQQLRPIALREIRHGWQLCISLILAFHQSSKCFLPSPKRCNRNSGRRKAGRLIHMTVTLHPSQFIHSTHRLFPLRPNQNQNRSSSPPKTSSSRNYLNRPRVRSLRDQTPVWDTAPCPRCRTHPQWD